MNLKISGLAILASVVVVVVIIAMYIGYWALAKDTTDRRYTTDTQNQQYQSGLIQQARDDARGWSQATDPGQKYILRNNFCGTYLNITHKPTDLADSATQIGCP